MLYLIPMGLYIVLEIVKNGLGLKERGKEISVLGRLWWDIYRTAYMLMLNPF